MVIDIEEDGLKWEKENGSRRADYSDLILMSEGLEKVKKIFDQHKSDEECLQQISAILSEIFDEKKVVIVDQGENPGKAIEKLQKFADELNGREWRYPFLSTEEKEYAEENGIVIVFGESDDLMEFEGAICDEGDCYDGGNVYFTRNGVAYINDDPCIEKYSKIEAKYCKDKNENGEIIAWTYETDIPHVSFMIMDGDMPDCRGVIFRIEDVKKGK